MRADLLILAAALLPPVTVAGTVRFAWPRPWKAIATQVVIVTLLPLALLVGYLVYEYSTSRWAIFPYGSLAPHALAGLIFLLGLAAVLWKAAAPTTAKIILGVVTIAAWVAFWFATALFTACAMGDCI